MSDSNEPLSYRENRLGEAVAWYYQSAEVGIPPDRADFLARYPDLRPELESFLADKEAFNRLAGPRPDPDATLRPAPNPETAHYTPASDQTTTLPPSKTESVTNWTLGSVRYFGDYELLAEIARGGMGVVYRARQVSLHRLVALKMILAGQFASEADVTRFHIEAEAAAHLDHPNIVPIYEIGKHENHHYYSMQYVEGPSLANKLNGAVYTARDAAELVRVCAQAVQYAHERGVIHRDLKPANILLAGRKVVEEVGKNAGELEIPKITDFGLAKRVDEGAAMTGTGQILGTPSYMAPEQASSKKDIGLAVDVYALGAILYETLTGQPPFRAATSLDTVLQVISEEPVPPSRRQAKVPADLETICLKCLEKLPERRYISAGALADDLGRFLNREPILARPVSRTRRLGVWVRKRPWVIVGLAMVMILAVSLTAQSFYLENDTLKRESVFLEAQNKRLFLAQQTPPTGVQAGALRPAAERALQFLRSAAAREPHRRVYDEALDLLLAEHQGGEQLYPKPGGISELSLTRVLANREYPLPFALTRDGKLLQLPGVLFHLDTQTTTRFEGQYALKTWCDPTGTLLARRIKSKGLEVVERANEKMRLRIEPDQLEVLTCRWSDDGRFLAVVSGERSERTSRKVDTGPTTFLLYSTPALEKAHTLEVWDAIAGKRLCHISLPDPTSLARPEFSGDSRLLACITTDEIQVYATETGEKISSIPTPGAIGLAVSPDGKILAWSRNYSVKTDESQVTLLKLPGGEPIHELRSAEVYPIDRIAFTPDGRFVIGQSAYSAKVASALMSGNGDANRTSTIKHPTDRVCIWDAKDGRWLASLRGHAFAEGFGPNGELVVVRNSAQVAKLEEIELWRPAELVDVLDREGLTDWMYFQNRDRKVEPLLGWILGLAFSAVWIPFMWIMTTIKRIKEKRITLRTAHTCILFSVMLVIGGVSFFMTAIAQFAGHWEQLAISVRPANVTVSSTGVDQVLGLGFALLGVLSLILATMTGGLGIKCYEYAAYGDITIFFRRLQSLHEADEKVRKQQEKQALRITISAFCYYLVFVIIFGMFAYLDRPTFMSQLINSNNNGLLKLAQVLSLPTFAAMRLFNSLLLLAGFYVLMALVPHRENGLSQELKIPYPARSLDCEEIDNGRDRGEDRYY